MTQHLNHEQLCDLLLEPHGPGQHSSPHEPARRDSDLDAHQEHIASCLICASELELLRTAVTSFRATSIALTDRALSRHSMQRPFATLDSSRSRSFISPAFFWAATALLIIAALPVGLYRSNLNPFLKPPVPAVSNSSSPAPSAQSSLESDEALLEGVNQHLSADIPSPMEPLAGGNASSAPDSTASPQRKN
jgi:hypothetical protein